MLNYAGLPKGIRAGVELWVIQGVQPGGFLSAVIANDLREAIGRADHINGPLLQRIVAWFYNECPAGSWGSLKKAKAWAKKHNRSFVPEWVEE